MAREDDEDKDESAGLIDLDMAQFGSGSMNDPLRHAMGLRSAQDAHKMRLWNSWPSLFQNTIFHGEQDPEIKLLRHSGAPLARISRARALKDEGNELLKSGSLDKAIEKYEKAGGILRYVECVRPDWKNEDGSYKGIEDEWLHTDESALEGDSEEANDARALVISCYLNVALAAQKQEQWSVMLGATNEVLEKLEPANAKALFRRAQARVGPMTALDSDREAAIEDLTRAAKAAPQDKAVRELLGKLKAEKQLEIKADREKFSGLFDRGKVVTNDPRLEGDKPDPTKLDLRDPKVQAMLDVRPGPQDLERLEGRTAARFTDVAKKKSKEAESDEEDKGGGLINLDMKQFGSGSMEDPLKHAMALRSAQDAPKMRIWSSWPSLFQNTIFHGEQDAEIKSLRHSGSLDARIARAKAMKDDGNALLKTDDLQNAIETYEKAAGILRYVECVRPDWKNDDGSYKGIEDQWLRVDESAIEGDTEEHKEARALVCSCYLNIALAAQKQKQWPVMLAATDEILDKVDALNVKALFRRAQARVAPMTAQDSDRDAAIDDLTQAARLAPQDKAVRELLAQMKADRKAQHKAERSQFSGLFERGHVVTNDPRLEGDRLDPSKLDIRDPKVQAMLDIRPGPQAYQNHN